MNRWHPGAPAPADEQPPPADTGGGAIMYTVTKALPIAAPEPEGADMAIRTNNVVSSSSALDLPEGTPFYEDANLANKAGTVSQNSTGALHRSAEEPNGGRCRPRRDLGDWSARRQHGALDCVCEARCGRALQPAGAGATARA